MADRDAIDRAFHGYEPLRIVDDVINSFNDCALRRGSPVSLRPLARNRRSHLHSKFKKRMPASCAP